MMAYFMRLLDALRLGLIQAHRRIAEILLDVVWKGVWLAITALAALLVVLWVTIELGSIEINDPAGVLDNPLMLAVLARQLWYAYAVPLLLALVAFITLSALAWILLEAYSRARLLAVSDASRGTTSNRFWVFLTTSILKYITMGSITVLLATIVFGRYLDTPLDSWRILWPDTRTPFAVALLIWIAVWFVLGLIEALIRTDSVDLLGSDLFTVVGVMGTMAVIEGALLLLFVAMSLVLAAAVTGPEGVILFLGVIATGVLALSVLRSYLLIVRLACLSVLQARHTELSPLPI